MKGERNMKDKERRRRLLKKVVLIGGVLSMIGSVIYYIHCQRVKTEIQKINEIVSETLGVELEQMEIETDIITNIVLSSSNEYEALGGQVEYKNCGQALMNPYRFSVKGDDIFFSIHCKTEAKEGDDAEIGLKIYALEKMDCDSIRKSIEKPIVSMKSDYCILSTKECINSKKLYLAEISYKGALSYFSFKLK